MQTVVDCPSCTRKLNVPKALLGQLVKCPTCAATFTTTSAAGPGFAEPPEAIPDLPPAPAYPLRPLDSYPGEEDWSGSRRHRSGEKPGKVQAIAIMTLVGGILATVNALVFLLFVGAGSGGLCCLWPGPYYGLTVGILAIVKGSQLMGEQACRLTPPRAVAVMQIINIINLDVPNCVLGILSLVFLSEPETAEYFRG